MSSHTVGAAVLPGTSSDAGAIAGGTVRGGSRVGVVDDGTDQGGIVRPRACVFGLSFGTIGSIETVEFRARNTLGRMEKVDAGVGTERFGCGVDDRHDVGCVDANVDASVGVSTSGSGALSVLFGR